jgi:tRNA threonylcarbamoyladenosine biosynthesis protein TsaB
VIVLGIDTSGSTSSAALVTAAGAWSACAEEPRSHGRVLPELIESACAQAGVALTDVTHVAVARGPGLFTGMRVGLVSAQMLAMALGLPIAGVSTLEAAAHRVVVIDGPQDPFWVLIDARRREVFAQPFDPAGRPAAQPHPLPASQAALLAEAAVFRDAGAAALGIRGHPLSCEGLAGEVAVVAAQRWRTGQPQEPATALYLRRPDVTPANPTRSALGRP